MLLRALVQGAPGSGKTSLLASAANAGYRILLQDYDHCPEPLIAYTTEEGRRNVNLLPFIGDDAFEKQNRFIDTGRHSGHDYGKPAEWGSETILVLDSLTEAAPYAELYVATIDHNPDQRMRAWNAGKQLEAICRQMKRLKCHVVVIGHLRLVAPHVESGYVDKQGQYKGQDTALQRQVKIERAKLEETAFYPNVPAESVARNFVHLFPFSLLTEVDEKAKHASKCIVRTSPITGYQIKCPIAGIADKLPIETAMTTILGELQKY